MRTKRLIYTAALATMLPIVANAADNGQILSKITYQPSVEGWVATDSVDVNVAINAALNNANVADKKESILNKLKGVAKDAVWHLASFKQSQDSSGLTRLTILANARLPQSATTNLTGQLKKISQSGEQYSVAGMAFTPSNQEINAEKTKLRDQLYQKIVSEIKTLNKTYHQRYFPMEVTFNDNSVRPMPVMLYKAVTNNGVSRASALTPSVASRLMLTANVTLAAEPSDSAAS